MNGSTKPLLPCPFCGRNNVRTYGPVGWYSQWGISHSCSVFYNGTSEIATGFHTEEAAIDAWNTRVNVVTIIPSEEHESPAWAAGAKALTEQTHESLYRLNNPADDADELLEDLRERN